MEKWLSLILVVVRNYGVSSAASDNILNRGGKLEETRWETEMLRDGWNDKEDKEEFQEPKERQECNAKTVKSSEVRPLEWFGVEHREEAPEEVHRYF